MSSNNEDKDQVIPKLEVYFNIMSKKVITKRNFKENKSSIKETKSRIVNIILKTSKEDAKGYRIFQLNLHGYTLL